MKADDLSDEKRVDVSRVYSQILQSINDHSADEIIDSLDGQLDTFDSTQLQALSNRLPDMATQISMDNGMPTVLLEGDLDDLDIDAQLNALDMDDSSNQLFDKIDQIQMALSQRLSSAVHTNMPKIPSSRMSKIPEVTNNNYLSILLAASLIALCFRRIFKASGSEKKRSIMPK